MCASYKTLALPLGMAYYISIDSNQHERKVDTMKNIACNIALALAVVASITCYVGFCLVSDEVMNAGVAIMLIAGIFSLPVHVEDWKNEKNNAR